jgi:periplasmic protein TonB
MAAMYRSDLKPRDKSAAIAGVIAIHAGLLLLFLHLSGKIDLGEPQAVLRVFDLANPPPPPPPVQPPPRPKEKEAGSARKNLRSDATPVKAPKPIVVVPPVPQIAATETPRHGDAPTQGASDQPGNGTGAGGFGTGTGSGGGSGGDSGAIEPPHLVTPVLTGRDFPRDVLNDWPRGAEVFLRLRVDSRGYVSECIIDRGSGARAVDSTICNLVHERLRFRPAVNRAGQAVAGWFGYRQTAPR